MGQPRVRGNTITFPSRNLHTIRASSNAYACGASAKVLMRSDYSTEKVGEGR